MNMALDGTSFFDTGWLACFLGFPRVHPTGGALKTAEAHAFVNGWDLCDETPPEKRYAAYVSKLSSGDVVGLWVDDDSNIVEERWGIT
jgi:hypothetical protein